MCAALRKARDLAKKWASSHLDNYPPVIINVTDGVSTDGDPTAIAHEICQITTNDGQALVFNVHITDLGYPPTYYPTSEGELPNDKYAKQLFNISSIIPESSRTALQGAVAPGARGMIFNGDAASVKQMFVFATVGATQAQNLDPNM